MARVTIERLESIVDMLKVWGVFPRFNGEEEMLMDLLKAMKQPLYVMPHLRAGNYGKMKANLIIGEEDWNYEKFHIICRFNGNVRFEAANLCKMDVKHGMKLYDLCRTAEAKGQSLNHINTCDLDKYFAGTKTLDETLDLATLLTLKEGQ